MEKLILPEIYEQKKNVLSTCLNCNKFGHEFRKCKEPTTSWGIILVKILDGTEIEHKRQLQKPYDITNYTGVKINNVKDINMFNKYSELIRFLLVQRKHSLGYVEFIRGRYIPSNIEGIIYLFQQMTKEEIKDIGNLSFDELWDKFWNNDFIKYPNIRKEFQDSKTKFTQLSEGKNVELPLNFYVTKVKPLYENTEWGFPKGRKNRGETDEECAIREFCEETGYEKTDIRLITYVKPIVENIIGTNGISYRHIYFLAELLSNKLPNIDITKDTKNVEIGNIGLFTRDQATQLIREYHLEKKDIIEVTFLYYFDMIINKHDYSVSEITTTSDELINNELINNELINNELTNNELTNNELINNELINNETILHDKLNDKLNDSCDSDINNNNNNLNHHPLWPIEIDGF
jgi:8-oxo-dGTP pyrophosphatase MutT (NUDIX family)